MLEKEIPNPEPGKHKPFIVANFREILDALTAEEISFYKGVELLNNVAAKYYKKQDPVLFGEWLRTFEPLTKENNQWVLDCQIRTQELFNAYVKNAESQNQS